MWYLVMIMRRN